MKRIYLIDCPGIVPPSATDTDGEVLLRGSVRVENVANPAQYVPAVLEMCKRHHLERTYDLKLWSASGSAASMEQANSDGNMVGTPATSKQKTEEAIRFLEALARKGGRLLKGGEPDLDGVAKMVLNDFLRGKIPWFVPPPATEGAAEGGGKVGEDVGGGAKEEVGRDEMLGFTSHGKRKREVEVDEEAEAEAEADEEGDAGESQDEIADFEGFDEEDSELDEDGLIDAAAAGGVKVSEGESESEDESEKLSEFLTT